MNKINPIFSNKFRLGLQFAAYGAFLLLIALFIEVGAYRSFADDSKGLFPVQRPLAIEDKPYENVFIFKKADFEKGNPYVYGSYHVDDWTLNANWGGGALDVSRLIFQNGLLIPADNISIPGVTLPGDPADYLIQTNQLGPERSLFSFNEPKELNPVHLQITPPPGTYTRSVQVKAYADIGATIYYRFSDNDPWVAYVEGANDLILPQSKSVQFYASANGEQTPVHTVNYTIQQPVSADSDGDGIPDALEPAFNLPVHSETADYDQDNWNDLDELVRGSNPLDKTSVPANSDYHPSRTDGWSDWDEQWRFTCPTDSDSQPVSTGINNGEVSLIVLADNPIYEQAEPIESRRDSFLWAWSLSGSVIATDTLTDTTWELRLPGDEPYILRASKQSSPNLVMLGYTEIFSHPWRPELHYTGNQTVEEWLVAVQIALIQNAYTLKVISVDTLSTATVLAFEQWLQRELQLPQPFPWYTNDQPSIYLATDRRNVAHCFSKILAHLHGQMILGHPLMDLVTQILNYYSVTPPPIPTDQILRDLLNGVPVDPAILPPTVTAELAAQVRAALEPTFNTIPSARRTVTGTTVYENGTFYLRDDNGLLYLLEAGGAEIVAGARLTVQGQINDCLPASPNDPPVLQVTQIDENKPILALNNQDTDGDGLPDQWESFYFGRTNASPTDDPDGDGADNKTEMQRHTNPLDFDPLTRVRDYWLY